MSMPRGLNPLTDPSPMAMLQRLLACMLPAANTAMFRPSGVLRRAVLHSGPAPFGGFAEGQIPSSEYQTPHAQACMVHFTPIVGSPGFCSPPAHSANMMVLLVPSAT